TAQRPAIDLVSHLLGQVALGHRDDHPGDLGRWPAEVVDQAVHRPDALGPGALEGLLVDPLGHPALPADYPADPQQLPVAPLLQVNDLVEAVGHLTGQAGPADQADLEVAVLDAAQRIRQLSEQGTVRAGGGGSLDRSHVAPHGRGGGGVTSIITPSGSRTRPGWLALPHPSVET